MSDGASVVLTACGNKGYIIENGWEAVITSANYSKWGGDGEIAKAYLRIGDAAATASFATHA